MGERGHSLHVFGQNGRDLLSALGQRLAILATNDRWTSFVPVDAARFDDVACSRVVDRPILHVWFDDDFGVTVQAYASGAFLGELSLPGEPFADDDDEVAPSDVDLLATWEKVGVLTKAQSATLRKRMAGTKTLRAWALKHGLERLLDLPSFEPMPPDAPETLLLSLLPKGSTLVEGKKARKSARKSKAAPSSTVSSSSSSSSSSAPLALKDSWTDEEKGTVALHSEYWADVWSMNNWTLYNRYKKHLPKDQRLDVDRLCEAVALGDTEAVHTRVESILSRIWEREDWSKVIRDPELVDGDEDEWKAWMSRL